MVLLVATDPPTIGKLYQITDSWRNPIMNEIKWATKKSPDDFSLYYTWLVDKDPYNGLLYSPPYRSPIKSNQPRFVSLLKCVLSPFLVTVTFPGLLNVLTGGFRKKHKPINPSFPTAGNGGQPKVYLWTLILLGFDCPSPTKVSKEFCRLGYAPLPLEKGYIPSGAELRVYCGYISFTTTGQVTPLVGYSQEINSRVQPLGGPMVVILFIENSWQK